MIGLPTHLVGVAGAIFLAASLVPDSPVSSPLKAAQSPDAPVQSKGDRLPQASSSIERRTVSTVELVGVSRTTVILRDDKGDILFRSDPLTNTTIVARDVELPVITLKQEEKSPVGTLDPAERREGNQPAAPTGRKPKTLGCEGAVSPLAKGHTGLPSLCLAERDDSILRS